MLKFGIIAVGRDCADVLDEVLAPWVEAFARHKIHICLLSATFKDMGLPEGPDKPTEEAMERYAMKYSGNISSVMFRNYATEAEVRECGRQVLMARNIKADLIWLLDVADEYYTADQIDRIVRFVERNSLVAYYRVSLKNYVFDDKTYLTQPFQPSRIWWCKYGHRALYECNYDNDFLYAKLDKLDESDVVADNKLPSLTIPPQYVWVKHLSWVSNERSKAKVAYQAKRWNPPVGHGCSYAWDDQRGLIWNEKYFERSKQALPEVVHE
jgi:hypothetical protein